MMWWTPEEEGLQQLAEAAGAIPFVDMVEGDDIAEEDPPHAFLWHVPENVDGHPPVGPVAMNGVAMDYEGELLVLLNEVLAGFGQPWDDPDL
jgi:hypothetical protein